MKHLDSLKNTLYSKANNTNANKITLTWERQREREIFFAFQKRTVTVELRNVHEHILYL